MGRNEDQLNCLICNLPYLASQLAICLSYQEFIILERPPLSNIPSNKFQAGCVW